MNRLTPMDRSAEIEPREGYIRTAEGRLHYLDWGGRGLQAHFLHGNGFCAGTYAPFIKHLVGDLHVFASDARGHGDSFPMNPQGMDHWTVFADDLKILIEQCMSPPIIGMGHSLGAVATYMAASKYPQLFSGVVLIDPPMLSRRILWTMAVMRLLGLKGRIPLARAARHRRRVFKGKAEALKNFTSGKGIFKTWSEEFVQAYLECGLLEKDPQTAFLKCDPELEARIFESVPLNVWKYGRQISCPVLLIRGQHSDAFYAGAAERLRSLIADCELHTFPGSGHFVPMEKPRACAAVIADFVRRRLAGKS
jgi:pimeloyl-ACP methyl ester carboxylesterase